MCKPDERRPPTEGSLGCCRMIRCFRGGLRTFAGACALGRARAGRCLRPPPERVRAFGRDMTPRAAFASLSFVTIASIGASCWLEELILRKLPEWRYYGTLAFFELSVFTAFTWVSARHHHHLLFIQTM